MFVQMCVFYSFILVVVFLLVLIIQEGVDQVIIWKREVSVRYFRESLVYFEVYLQYVMVIVSCVQSMILFVLQKLFQVYRKLDGMVFNFLILLRFQILIRYFLYLFNNRVWMLKYILKVFGFRSYFFRVQKILFEKFIYS